MQYPKDRMSIKELMLLGFSRYELNKYAKDPKAPVIQHGKHGKITFDTTKLDDYLLNLRYVTAHKEPILSWSERKKALKSIMPREKVAVAAATNSRKQLSTTKL